MIIDCAASIFENRRKEKLSNFIDGIFRGRQEVVQNLRLLLGLKFLNVKNNSFKLFIISTLIMLLRINR